MVPTFEINDYCIFYYCIKVLEEFISWNRVDWTFWGFRLGWQLREQENQEFIEPDSSDSINENSFNAFAWKKEYWEYQAKLREYTELMWTQYNYCVQVDIANFYDTIRLDFLEKKIRDVVPSFGYNDEIMLLFRFLKEWNKLNEPIKIVWIPQDEVWDCSRILSNFYLQSYDKYISDYCNNCSAKYIRYADDQLFFTQNKDDAEEILYHASVKLFHEWLNFNTWKTKEYKSYDELNNYYGFQIFEKLRFDNQNVNLAFNEIQERVNNRTTFRINSILKRLLHRKIDLTQLTERNRISLIDQLWNEDFLLFSDEHYMSRLYSILGSDNERLAFIEHLKNIWNRVFFESYKINLTRFLISLENNEK